MPILSIQSHLSKMRLRPATSIYSLQVSSSRHFLLRRAMVHGELPIMGVHNGHVYLRLYEVLFIDLQMHYPELRTDLQRDLFTISKRFAREGLSFLTKTLPRFAKAIDFSLATGSRLVCPEFHNYGRTGLPAFLRGFLVRVFAKDGYPCDNPDPGALLELRQVGYLLYKLEVPYDETVVQKKIQDFLHYDDGLDFDPSRLSERDQGVLGCATALLTELFAEFSLKNALPKHGPGAVAGGEKPWQKMDFKFFVRQIDSEFPICDWYYLSPTHLCDELKTFLELTEVDSLSSSVTAVPKDSRGPRLIAKEPLEYMWIQQAIKGQLYPFVEQHPLTKGHVNFTNQEVNRGLALEASRDRYFATLDMKDASDSVSLALVRVLFSRTPLLQALLATRTPDVFANNQKHHYKKFAPMGSALCFPVEALVFWSIAVATLHVCAKVPLANAVKSVYVFGDDIIVPREYTSFLFNTFPSFCLKFNENKCCVDGFFRESCGCDAFHGVDVTPIKVKALMPIKRLAKEKRKPLIATDPSGLVSWIEYANEFYSRGYFNFGNHMRNIVEGILGPLPVANGPPNPLVNWGFATPQDQSRLRRRWNFALQCWQYRTWGVSPIEHKLEETNHWNGPFSSLLLGMRLKGPWVFSVPHRVKLTRRYFAI